MSASGRFDHLRHAALDMLESGNGTASVSTMLGVPVDVLVRWRDEPEAPPLEPARQVAALVAQGHVPRFDATLVVLRSAPDDLWLDTAWHYLRPLLVILPLAVAWNLWTHSSGEWRVYVDVVPLVACLWIWLTRHRRLFVLDQRAIVVPRLFGSTVMPYVDLKDWWLTMHVLDEGSDEEVEGRLLTLHSRGGRTRPIEVFVHDHVQIDPRVLERLELVKQANHGPGPLTRVGTWPAASS